MVKIKRRNFRELRVWIKASDLTKDVYNVLEDFPVEEKYGLVSQIKRALIGISSNIAEGCGRRTSRDFVGFLYNSMGSVREVQSQLIISQKLGFLDREKTEEFVGKFEELFKMIARFIDYVLSEDVK